MGTDTLLEHAAAYAASFAPRGLPAAPATKVAVLTCMDARVDPARLLGLDEGDAHVVRNAGGLATEDALRSLLLSQRVLGTTEIVLVHHTDCGLESLDEAELLDRVEADVGRRPTFSLGSFRDVVADVRETAATIAASPFVSSTSMRGFVFDVATGRLEEVPLGGAAGGAGA